LPANRSEPERPPRFALLDPDTMAPEARALVDEIMQFAISGIQGPFNALLRSPTAAAPLQQFGDYLRSATGLDDRLLELAILVHARAWADDYEWALHQPRALSSGLPAATVDAIRDGRTPASMQDDEAAVFHFCVELTRRRKVAPETFDRAKTLLGERGVVDLTLLLGNYALLSYLISVAEIAPPADAPPRLPPIADPFG